jgi:uncharacterized damage-inducible protein DinB
MLRAVAWADQQTLSALVECPQAQAEAVPLLAHVLGAENVWLARLQNQEPAHSPWPQLSLADCNALADTNASGYAAYLESLDESDFVTAVRYRNTKGDEFVSSKIDILTHVVIHGAYHRGQIAKVLGHHGVPAPNTDFITFTRIAGN